MNIKDKVLNFAGKLYVKFSGVAQERVEREAQPVTVTNEMKALLREVAGEGAVLLKNNGILPLEKGTRVSVFGRVQYN